ncbi:MAG: prepilin peptidase [Thermoanaerobaculaceae bacterium]|jgi:leader peptidase (prepilin peptidase)/N-methyltransferase|nr:prepilin peptidase [Thermoanaerobaculaceae bacterium]
MPSWFVLSAVAAYGLVLGSFLNVVIHRLPRGMSLLRPRSHCPNCGATVAWYDNVPVLSYLVLAGRCRQCKVRIPVRYPLVEGGTAALLVAAVARFGLGVWGVEAAVFLLLLVPLALIDLEHHLLPDWLTLTGLGAGLVASAAGGLVTVGEAVVGSVVGAAVPLAVMWVYRLVRGVEGMGLGDVKLLAMIGAFLGWRGVLLSLCFGACAGAVVGVALMATGRGRADTELPFGTFLAGAAALVLFFGEAAMAKLGWLGP